MSEVNPAGFLQNAGSTHTAEITRSGFTGLLAGISSGALTSRGGVVITMGGAFAVQQNGTPNMSVNVLSGIAYVPGSESAKQGVYVCLNDATKNVTIAASDPTLNRIDLIVAKVQDAFYSGGTNSWSIVAVTGTPAGSPSAPAAPANSITLAQVAVNAAVTTIVTGNITDKRPFACGLGGIIPYNTANQPLTSVMSKGQLLYNLDASPNRIEVYDGTNIKELAEFLVVKEYSIKKAANEIVNNNSTLQNDDDFFWSVTTNTNYLLDMHLFFLSNTTADLKIGWTFPTSTTMTWGVIAVDTGGTLVSTGNFSQTLVAGFGGTGVDQHIHVFGTVNVAGTAGTFRMQWAQNTANASNTIMYAGSHAKLTRITY